MIRQAAFSYLTAWLFAISIALGALIFLMIVNITGGKWPEAYRRHAERIAGALPLLAVLFVPIALAVAEIYPWVGARGHRAAYLDVPFWAVRAAIFLASWVITGELVVRTRSRAVSAGLLPPLALTLTFAAFDWLMSLTPDWSSTIFGMLFFAGGFYAALALLAIVQRRATPDETGALGRLMFAFLVFWAYLEFSQGIIIWLANRPDEVPWYVARGAGGWSDVFGLLGIAGFAIPFFALLSRPLKRVPLALAVAGAWLVATHYLDIYWMVMPVLHGAPSPHWLDLATVLGVAGACLLFARWRRP